MLLSLLSSQEKLDFLSIAKLLTICSKEITWDGKKLQDVTAPLNFDKFSIKKSEKEISLMNGLAKEAGIEISKSFKDNSDATFSFWSPETIEKQLLNKIKNYPFLRIEEPTTRVGAALAVLKDLLSGKRSDFPAAPKLILFELMQVALVNGSISGIAMQLINEFKQHYKIEDFVFHELLEQAEVTSREISKTITIIFE